MKKLLPTLFLLLAALLAACSADAPGSSATLQLGKYTYRGQTDGGRPDGYGVLVLGDSTVYSGQWRDGRRCGYGTTADTAGREVTALWAADTIVYGAVSDSSGTYLGEFVQAGARASA